MKEEEVLELLRSLPDVEVVTAVEGDGSPEIAWGDSFATYKPDDNAEDAHGFQPFVTVVTKDYEGFDMESDLNRDGVFRINLAIGRERSEELLGFRPSEMEEQRRAEIDFAQLDCFIPHPQYAANGWVSILNPSSRDDELRALVHEAYERAVSKKSD